MTIVVKRDCTEEPFDKTKILNAISKAMKYGSGIIKSQIAINISNEIANEVKDLEEVSI